MRPVSEIVADLRGMAAGLVTAVPNLNLAIAALEQDYQSELHEYIRETIQKARGKVLGEFTSDSGVVTITTRQVDVWSYGQCVYKVAIEDCLKPVAGTDRLQLVLDKYADCGHEACRELVESVTV